MRKTTSVVAGSPAPSVESDAADSHDTKSDDASAASTGAEKESSSSGSRYSWNDDPERTHLLLDLVTDAFQRKPADRRNIRSSEWDVLFQAYNREASAPVESVKILHNRLAILRHQCKDYHEVLMAQRRGELETDDDWREFSKDRSVVRKWRKTPFLFYDEMVECMRAQGEYLDDIDAEEAGEGAAGKSARRTRRRKGESHTRDVRRRTDADESASAATVTTKSDSSKHEATAEDGSSYTAALRDLKRLQLSLEERVDAKRFLVDEANAKAFIHMDEEEQFFFLDKYCFYAPSRPAASRDEH